MEDIKVYEFFLKLNTYLNRQNHLTNKMMEQETELGRRIMVAKTMLSPEVFDSVFKPMVNVLENRVKTMNEMRENADEFNKNLQEFFGVFKGTVQ
jgi:hypothetical protein